MLWVVMMDARLQTSMLVICVFQFLWKTDKGQIPYVIVITHPWGLYLSFKRDGRVRSPSAELYKSDTNQMDVLQLLCFMVHEQIKDALSLCLAWRMILYCWSRAAELCGWFSWWKALGFHAVKLERIYHTDSHNQPCVQNLYKCTIGATNQLATHIICMKHALHHG